MGSADSTDRGAGIVAENVTKAFGPVRALRGVSLRVDHGSCTALLGPNGAGKSTLLGVLSTLVRPSSGRVLIDGVDASVDGPAARQAVGMVSHSTWTYDKLSVHENLRFFAGMYGLSGERASAVEEDLGLSQVTARPAGELSRGMRQRLSLARALLHEPSALLLDEPYTGLDAASSDVLATQLRRLRDSGAAIVLVTHDVKRAWADADRAVLMLRGAIAHEQPTSESGPEQFIDALKATREVRP